MLVILEISDFKIAIVLASKQEYSFSKKFKDEYKSKTFLEFSFPHLKF